MVSGPSPRGGRSALLELELIRLSRVRFGYDERTPVLDGIELQIPTGLVLVAGPNGAGKSTLLKLLAGVERPDQGNVEIDGCDMWLHEVAARRSLAYVPEHPDLTPYATIGEILRLVSRLRGEHEAAGAAALARCGLRDLEGRSVRELSMGQRRRAVLAAAMIGSPKVILLDDPLEAMDRAMRGEILSWIESHRLGGSTVVIVTHEIEPFVDSADGAVSVRAGKVRLHHPLPADPTSKAILLDALARGVLSASESDPAKP
jgi:ABC-type multidrug transport system ATPase subunit